jgi:hypothetical protein
VRRPHARSRPPEHSSIPLMMQFSVQAQLVGRQHVKTGMPGPSVFEFDEKYRMYGPGELLFAEEEMFIRWSAVS